MATRTHKIVLQTESDTQGAEKVASALVEVRQEAEGATTAAKGLENALDQAASESISGATREAADFGDALVGSTSQAQASAEELNDEFAGMLPRLARLPGPIGDIARQLHLANGPAATLGLSLGRVAAGAAGVGAIGLMAKAYIDLGVAVGKGALAAAELAEELHTLPADKAAELRRELGPLADAIDANSVTLRELNAATKETRAEFENFWATAGVRAAPAMLKIANAAKQIDLSGVAERVGDTVNGALLTVGDVTEQTVTTLQKLDTAFRKVSGGVDLTDVAMRSLINFNPALVKGYELADAAVTKWIGRSKEAGEASEELTAAQKAAEEQQRAAAIADELAAAKSEKVTKAREAQMSTEEQLAAAKARQATLDESALSGESKAIAEAAANEALIVTLDARLAKEQEIELQKQEQQAAAKEAYELQVQLAEAVAAGNEPEAARVRYAQDYAAALKSANGDDSLAKRMADAQALERSRSESAKLAAKAEAATLSNLRDQIALERERSQTRAAELKANGADEKTIAKERAAAAERIRDIELQIAQIQGTADQAAALHAEQRKQDALAISAAEAAARAKDPTASTAGGDLFDGTNRRRGSVTSDAFEQPVGLGGSGLDTFAANQSAPVGATQGKSILPADPTSSVAQSGANGQTGAGKSLSQAATKQESSAAELNSAASAVTEAASAIESAATAIVSSHKSIVKRMSKVESQLKSLADKA